MPAGKESHVTTTRMTFTWHGRLATGLAALCLAAGAAAEPAGARIPASMTDAAEARVIVKFKTDAATLRAAPMSSTTARAEAVSTLQTRADALAVRAGRPLTTGRAVSERAQVVMATGLDSEALARALRADPQVAYAVPDRRRTRLAVPNDPLFAPTAGTSPASGQWYLKAPTASVRAGIDSVSAWDLASGTGVVVAVLDTGIRADHADLAGQILPGYDMVHDVAISNDGSGRDADGADPGDWITSSEASSTTFKGCAVSDSSWHGTQVSGLVAALGNNGLGMAGVASGSKVLPVRVLGKCFGYDSDIIAGMRWAAGRSVAGAPANPNPARVLNLSLGGDGECNPAYAEAVSELTAGGTVIVVAAGNSSGHALGVPANCPGVIAVAGVRHTGTKVAFSDVGPEVTVSAPGGNCVSDVGDCQYPILSTTNRGKTTPVAGATGATYTNGSNYAVGTSFSAPMVSGAVALMLSVNPSLTPAQAASLIKATARPFPATGADAGVPSCGAPTGVDQYECYCSNLTCGAGMLDVGAAVRAAAAGMPAGYLDAVVSASPAIPDPGQVVTLSASGTQVGAGRTIVSRTWSLVDGGGIVQGFQGSHTGDTAVVVPSAVGRFVVRLTVQDDQGQSDSTDLGIDVSALSVTLPAPTAAPVVGQSFLMRAVNVVLSPGRKIAAYGWSLPEGDGTVAVISSAPDVPSIIVRPVAAGMLTVRLTVTDDVGKQVVASWQGTVAPAGGTPVAGPAQSGGGSGGGAIDLLVLVAGALGLSAWGAARRQRRH